MNPSDLEAEDRVYSLMMSRRRRPKMKGTETRPGSYKEAGEEEKEEI